MTLFDDVGGGLCDSHEQGTGGTEPPVIPQNQWREVPQARYLSWSEGQQLAYNAARDRDSAEHANDDEWREFYLRRAESYETR